MIKRIYNFDDIDQRAIERLGKMFVNESGVGGNFEYHHFKKMFQTALVTGVGAVWVQVKNDEVVGIISGLVFEYFFVPQLAAVEAFWYVEKSFRGTFDSIRLLEQFENWARENKVKWVHLAHMEGIHPDKMRGFFQKRGYSLYESVYRMRL